MNGYFSTPMNYDSIRYTGYKTEDEDYDLNKFFSQQTVNYIKGEVNRVLKILSSKNIIVVDDVILSVMNNIWHNRSPEVNDIYSAFNIPSPAHDFMGEMIRRVVSFISFNLYNEIQMVNTNKKFNRWHANFMPTPSGVQFNEDMNRYPKIKLRNKRPTPFQFHMKY